jgi:hypothetical protein
MSSRDQSHLWAHGLQLERLHIYIKYSRRFAAGWNSSDRSISSFAAIQVPSYAYKDQRRTNLSLKGLANPTSPYFATLLIYLVLILTTIIILNIVM